MRNEENMTVHILVLIFIIILCCILLFVYSGMFRASGRVRSRAGQTVGSRQPGMPCPLCGTPLGPGERLTSHIYRAGADSLSHILGCPHCNPQRSGRNADGQAATRNERLQPRICPVCRRELAPDGYLIARVFERDTGRNAAREARSTPVSAETGGTYAGRPGRPTTHVHVLGCTECRRR